MEMTEENEVTANFDLDSTLADYHMRMCEELSALESSPAESWDWDNNWQEEKWPKWLKARTRLIKSKVGFWENLPRLQLGFDILGVAQEYGFNCEVLTRGPKWHPPAFEEKVRWCAKHVPDLHVNLVRNKSRFYGKLLVDDWPDYFLGWLKVRPRGWVIAVEQPWNRAVVHPRLLKYNGANLNAVHDLFRHLKTRNPGEI